MIIRIESGKVDHLDHQVTHKLIEMSRASGLACMTLLRHGWQLMGYPNDPYYVCEHFCSYQRVRIRDGTW